MAAYSNERVAAIILSVLYRMLTIRKAEQLMHDLDAYEELGDNLLLWFYEKIYHKPYPTDDASEFKMLID